MNHRPRSRRALVAGALATTMLLPGSPPWPRRRQPRAPHAPTAPAPRRPAGSTASPHPTRSGSTARGVRRHRRLRHRRAAARLRQAARCDHRGRAARVRATDPARKIGTLFVNPADRRLRRPLAAAAEQFLTEDVRAGSTSSASTPAGPRRRAASASTAIARRRSAGSSARSRTWAPGSSRPLRPCPPASGTATACSTPSRGGQAARRRPQASAAPAGCLGVARVLDRAREPARTAIAALGEPHDDRRDQAGRPWDQPGRYGPASELVSGPCAPRLGVGPPASLRPAAPQELGEGARDAASAGRRPAGGRVASPRRRRARAAGSRPLGRSGQVRDRRPRATGGAPRAGRPDAPGSPAWTWASAPCASRTWTAQDETRTAARSPHHRRAVLVVGNYWDPATSSRPRARGPHAGPAAVVRPLGAHRVRHVRGVTRGRPVPTGRSRGGHGRPVTAPSGEDPRAGRRRPTSLPPVVPPLPGAAPRS